MLVIFFFSHYSEMSLLEVVFILFFCFLICRFPRNFLYYSNAMEPFANTGINVELIAWVGNQKTKMGQGFFTVHTNSDFFVHVNSENANTVFVCFLALAPINSLCIIICFGVFFLYIVFF